MADLVLSPLHYSLQLFRVCCTVIHLADEETEAQRLGSLFKLHGRARVPTQAAGPVVAYPMTCVYYTFNIIHYFKSMLR